MKIPEIHLRKHGEETIQLPSSNTLVVKYSHVAYHINSPRLKESCMVSPGRSRSSDKDRKKGKGRRCWLGDVLECHTNHLAAWMI